MGWGIKTLTRITLNLKLSSVDQAMLSQQSISLSRFFVALLMLNGIAARPAFCQSEDSPIAAAKTSLHRMNQAVTAGEFKIARVYMTDQGATEVIGDLAGIAISLADPAINESFPAQFDAFKKEFNQLLSSAQLTTKWAALNDDPTQFEKFQSLQTSADGLNVLDQLLNAVAAMPWNGFGFRGVATAGYQKQNDIFIAIGPEEKKEFAENANVSVYRFVLEGDIWKFDGISNDQTEAYQKKLDAMPMTIKDPSFTGETADGNKLSFADYKGKVVLFDFWGTWCAPCVAKIPKLKKIHAAFQPHGFEIIGVALDDAETLKTFYESRTLPWKNLADPDGELEEKFGVKAYPTTMLLDLNGTHIASNLKEDELVDALVKLYGLNPNDFAALKKAVKDTDDEKRHK